MVEPMPWREYGKAVLVQARDETISIIKHQAPWDVLVIAAAAIVGLLMFDEPWVKIVGLFVGGVVGLAVVIVVVGVWSVTWAPVNLARTDKSRIKTLESFSNPELDVIASFPRYYDDGIDLYVILTEVHIINRSVRRVNLDVELDIRVDQEDGSDRGTYVGETYVPNKAVDAAIPDDDKRGGILHSPLVIEAKDRTVGYFIFKVDAEMRQEIGLNKSETISRVELELVDGVTNVTKTYPVPETIEEVFALSDQKRAEKGEP